MRNLANTALFAATSFLALGTALAQTSTPVSVSSPAAGGFVSVKEIRATVPFDFTVGNKLMPPGTYSITSPSQHVIQIRNMEKHVSALSMVSTDGGKSFDGGRLVFDKCGEQYFLRKVPSPAAAKTVDLPASRVEKQAQMEQASWQKASETTIAAK
jgi:hypothetical protein